MRIDLRDSKGGHYMDIITAVTHVDHVTGRDNIAMNYKEPTVQTSKTRDTLLRTVSTEDVTVNSVGTDTDDMVSYVQEATVKQYTNANSKPATKLRKVECECAETGCA
jgi:preprotein translocase subunit SecF